MQAEYEYPYDHAERSAYELPPDDLRDEEHDAYEDNDTGYDPAEVCVCQSEHDFLQLFHATADTTQGAYTAPQCSQPREGDTAPIFGA